MSSNGWWVLIGVALLFGMAAGGWVTLRVARLRHASQSRRALDEMQLKFAANLDQLRAGQVRAQTELEQMRGTFRRQLAAATEEPRAAAARAESRLVAAYAELDRLRRGANPPDTKASELADGFAATRPLRENL